VSCRAHKRGGPLICPLSGHRKNGLIQCAVRLQTGRCVDPLTSRTNESLCICESQTPQGSGSKERLKGGTSHSPHHLSQSSSSIIPSSIIVLIMSHTQTSRVTHQRVTSHTSMSHVAHINESCRTQTSRVTHINYSPCRAHHVHVYTLSVNYRLLQM